MVGYHAVEDRSRSRNDDDNGHAFDLSSALGRISGDDELDNYKTIVKSRREGEDDGNLDLSKRLSFAQGASQTW